MKSLQTSIGLIFHVCLLHHYLKQLLAWQELDKMQATSHVHTAVCSLPDVLQSVRAQSRTSCCI